MKFLFILGIIMSQILANGFNVVVQGYSIDSVEVWAKVKYISNNASLLTTETGLTTVRPDKGKEQCFRGSSGSWNAPGSYTYPRVKTIRVFPVFDNNFFKIEISDRLKNTLGCNFTLHKIELCISAKDSQNIFKKIKSFFTSPDKYINRFILYKYHNDKDYAWLMLDKYEKKEYEFVETSKIICVKNTKDIICHRDINTATNDKIKKKLNEYYNRNKQIKSWEKDEKREEVEYDFIPKKVIKNSNNITMKVNIEMSHEEQ